MQHDSCEKKAVIVEGIILTFKGQIKFTQGYKESFQKQEKLTLNFQWPLHFITLDFGDMISRDRSITNGDSIINP